MVKRKRNLLLSALAMTGLGLTPACSTSPLAGPSGSASPSASAPAKAPAPGWARPIWATSQQLVGTVDRAQTLALQVHLANRNPEALAADIAAVTDPDSPRYRQFLSDEEFAAKYAPTAADVAAVRTHLEANGLRVTYVPNNRAYIAVEGSAAQVESAFATKLGLYQVDGKLRHAPIDQPSLPADLQARVSGVLGLHTPAVVKPHNVRLGGIPRSALKNVKPNASDATVQCSQWFGAKADTTDPAYTGYSQLTYAPCGYRPGQIRAAYGFKDSIRAGNDGTGETIAIIDAYLSPTLVSDAQTYAANNDPDYPLADGQLTTVWAPGTPSTPDPGWYGEQTLDVEAAHATAPGAKLIAVAAQSSQFLDLVAAFNLIIDQKLANIVSNSWGSVEGFGSDYVLFDAIFQQAAAKGIGIYFASGDEGDDSYYYGYPAASFPATSDLVTAVGGTSLAIGQTGQTLFETAWETGVSFAEPSSNDPNVMVWFPDPPGFWYFGGGGGTSTRYAQPKWQAAVVPPDIANLNHPGVNAPARAIPDVSLIGDPVTGFLVGQSDPSTGVYAEAAYGGTSLSTPLFAGLVALAQQNLPRSKHSFGPLNPTLYKAAKKGAFRDVLPLANPVAVVPVAGVVTTFDDEQGMTIHVTPGWDNITGLGVPDGKNFLKAVK